MILQPGLRSIFVGMTMVYAYIFGIMFFGLVLRPWAVNEEFRDLTDFFTFPVKMALRISGVSFLGIWILIFLIWFMTKDRLCHCMLKLAVMIIASTCFFLIVAVWITYISLYLLVATIRDPSIEWGYFSPPLSPPTWAIVLFLTALACGLSAIVYFWSRRVTKPALLELKKMIAETCGKCGYLMYNNKTICTECGWERKANDNEIESGEL